MDVVTAIGTILAVIVSAVEVSHRMEQRIMHRIDRFEDKVDTRFDRIEEKMNSHTH